MEKCSCNILVDQETSSLLFPEVVCDFCLINLIWAELQFVKSGGALPANFEEQISESVASAIGDDRHVQDVIGDVAESLFDGNRFMTAVENIVEEAIDNAKLVQERDLPDFDDYVLRDDLKDYVSDAINDHLEDYVEEKAFNDMREEHESLMSEHEDLDIEVRQLKKQLKPVLDALRDKQPKRPWWQRLSPWRSNDVLSSIIDSEVH